MTEILSDQRQISRVEYRDEGLVFGVTNIDFKHIHNSVRHVVSRL